MSKVLFPPTWFKWLFALLSFAAVAAVFLCGLGGTPFSYVAYFASALGLYYAVSTVVPQLSDAILKIIMSSPYLRRCYEDSLLRARIGLFGGTALNVLYAVFNLVSGIWLSSTWLIAIGTYYLALMAVKSTIVVEDVRHIRGIDGGELTEWKAHRRAGFLMLLLNVGLSGITAQIVATGARYEYPGFFIFAVAVWAFYYIINAVVQIVRKRHDDDAIYAAARAISLSFGITSMFTLQTAMFASFGANVDALVPNIVTSTVVGLSIVVISIAMIVRANRHIESIEADRGA